MDAVLGVARDGDDENVGIVDRLVGCLQPVLTVLGKATPKQHKSGIFNTCCTSVHCYHHQFRASCKNVTLNCHSTKYTYF